MLFMNLHAHFESTSRKTILNFYPNYPEVTSATILISIYYNNSLE